MRSTLSAAAIFLSIAALPSPSLQAQTHIYTVGVAKIDITPKGPIRLCGYLARTKESEGIEQRLWARALAIGSDTDGPAILMTVENTAIPARITEEVSRRLAGAGVKRERFAICSTHTHTGPCLAGNIPNMFAMDLPESEEAHIAAYTKELIDKLEKVARSALADRQPAQLAWGKGKLTFAANRRTKGGPVDHDMPMLRVTDPSGKLRAILVNYACHCTTLGPEMNKVCGDWAGYALEAIEQANPGVISLVSIGCGGDANPEPRTGVNFARQHGHAVADEVGRLLKSGLTPLTGSLSCRLKRIELPFDAPPSREELAKRAQQKDFLGYHARKDLARLDRGEKLESQLPYYVQTFTFGDQLGMVFLSGEVVVDYSLRLKKDFDATRLWINAYSNDVACYIPSRRILKEGGYEAEQAMHFYDHPARLAPVVENQIIRTVHELLPDSFRTAEQKAAFPLPLSPEEVVNSFHLPEGLRIELIAAEPLVVDPVAIDFGPDGKLWVAEMRDYPTGLHEDDKHGGGDIKYLEDTDGDGRYDKATVFVDGLSLPTGVLHWRKGILYCAAPDIVYAEDTDGDGKADVKEVLCSGFSPENTQALVNGFAWGLDGWVHGASSIASKPIHVAKTDKTVDINGQDFRMKPDTGEFEAAAGRAQYGRVRDDFDNWFGNDNSTWLFHYPMPDRYVRRNLNVPSPNPRVSVAHDPDFDVIYPVSRTLERFNEPTRANRVTSACSPAIYRDDLLGSQYANNAFICEVVHNVIHRLVLEADDVTFAGHRAPEEKQSEFLASKDNWFRPAQIRTGPDGCLWIADMYRFVIEEPVWISPERLAYLDIRAGEDRGRIYRIVRKDYSPRRVPRFTGLRTRVLAELLDNPNGPLRDMVHQELLQRGDASAAGTLRTILRQSLYPAARLQAFCALTELNQAGPDDIQFALADADPKVRAHAVMTSERYLSADSAALQTVRKLASDKSPQVRYQVALSLGEATDTNVGDTLAQIVLTDFNNTWLRTAVLTSASSTADQVLASVVKAKPSPARDEMIGHLVATAVASGKPGALERLSKAVTPADADHVAAWQINAAVAILDARDRKNAAIDMKTIEPVFIAARKYIEDDSAKESLRIASARVLGRGPDQQEQDIGRLATLLAPQTPAALQAAAIGTLGKLRDPRAAGALLERWSSASPTLRAHILDALLSRPEPARALLAAIEAQQVLPAEIDAAHRGQLFKHADAQVRGQAETLLASVRPAGRKQVLDKYKPVFALKGDVAAGAPTFEKLCASCHSFRGVGHEVGPNLVALTDRSTNYLLTSILDPNAAVEAKYTAYIVELTDGRTLSGIIIEETSSSVTVLQGNGVRDTVLRSDVTELRSSNLSLMPEGLEESLSQQQVADLIAFVQSAPRPLGSSTPEQALAARHALYAEGLSGCTRVISAFDVAPQMSWLGRVPLHYCRQTDGMSKVTWQSAPTPRDPSADSFQRFRLPAAMGLLSQPAAGFKLSVNGHSAMTFDVTVNDQTWTSSDDKVRMTYTVMQNNTEDSTGVLVIEVHTSLLGPGQAVTFQVIGKRAESQRWFGVLMPPAEETNTAPKL